MIRHISLVSALIAATAACVTGFAAVVTDNNAEKLDKKRQAGKYRTWHLT